MSTSLAALAMPALLSTACGLALDVPTPATTTRDPAVDAPSETVEPDAPVEPVEPLPPRLLPSSLSCASDELEPHAGSTVARLSFWLGEGGSGTLSFGPAFLERGDGSVTEPPAVETLTIEGVVDVDGVSTVETQLGALVLSQQGAFYVGRFDMPHQVVDVTCWNDAELFGNAWAGTPGLLPAHFDWSTGDCRDAQGEPARNELPIAFVREARFGDCADLRGAKLNGTDYMYPVLSGFSLAGADLAGAELYFADLRWAFLVGADLSELVFGYANIDGQVDDHTVLPIDGCVVTEGDFGDTVACRR